MNKTFTSGQGMRQIILIVLLTLLSLVQISCKTSSKSSVLIIAVDEVIYSDVLCNKEDQERSGFELLCNESVRFTHAFTPSTLATPALTSILTAQYPYQHKVRNNGGPGLEAEIETAAEVALKNGYRTSFYSGGAPIFRRSGLNQGFEVFDDNIAPTFKSLFRPFRKNASAFINWLNQDVGRDPYFSVIYAPDLLFTTTETTSELGEARNLSFESQLDELDETLFELFKSLKAAQRWDNTTVIFVGLNGHTAHDRPKQITSLNLHSENTQVALLIKPHQAKKRDQGVHWKVDQNVTLVDIGKTLFEVFGEKIEDKPNATFPTYSLLPVLNEPGTPSPEGRSILLESGWAQWRNAGPIKTAVINNHILLIHEETPQLFNTLVDRFEVNPLPLLQESILPTTRQMRHQLAKNQMPAFPPLNKEWLAKLSLPFARWMRADQEDLLLKDLKRLSQAQPQSIDLLNWTAQIALNRRDWDALRQLGQKHNVASWQYVAEKNLNAKNPRLQDPCFTLLSSLTLETEQLKSCSDPLFLELVDWLRAETRGLSKDMQRKRFERSFRYYLLDQQIQRTNIAAGLIWDTARENTFAPSRTELALSLPEYTRYRSIAYKSILSEEL